MNALACAPDNVNSRASQFNFNWKKHEVNVKKLQMRIVKAQQERRYNKVKAIQWLLVHSFSAKILAIKRVTENKGKKTPGIDQVTWTTQKQKYEGCNELRRVGYTAEPLRRVFHTQEEWKKATLRYTHYERQGSAGIIFAGTRPSSRNDT
jgi:RNA-directed DNA polymerase